MSILKLNQNRKRIMKISITTILTGWFVLLFIIAFLPVAALAGGIGDVVTEVANAHFTSTQFDFSNENQTGHNFKMHMGGGDFGKGMGGVTVLGPVDAAGMQIMLDYIDGEAQHTSIQTTRIKGCEVREYTMAAGNGVGVVLPDYFITVEIYESGNSSASDLALAKKIAQQTLDGLERNGLLSQPAPDIEKPAGEEPSKTAPETSAFVTGKPLDEPIPVSNTMNIAGVYNGATVPTTFNIASPHLVTYISTYHWNNAQGTTPGTIALQDSNGKVYGPWQVTSRPGQGGVPNAYWEVLPNIIIPAGTYTVIDSDPSTWSQNAESGGRGMGEVKATPHFEVTSGSVDDLNKGTSGSSSHGGDRSESPAGVGSVGNIPGPSNTTEAVVGVVVPGLIATGMGALAGLGGGGFAPPGGTPLSPNAGGTAPGSGGTGSGAGAQQAGAAKEVNQLGRKRREEIYGSDSEIRIDTTEMGRGSITVASEDGLLIETADEAAIFVEPEPGIRIDTTEMGRGLITVASEDGLLIETADEAAIFVQPEPGIRIDTTEMGRGLITVASEDGLLIETADEAGIFVEPEPGIRIDTIEMGRGSITVASEDGLLIETADEAAIFVQPEPGIIIEPAEEGAGLIKPDSGMIIDTADEAAIFVQPEPGVIIDTADEGAVLIKPDAGIIIDTADETGVLIQTDQIVQPAAPMSDTAEIGILLDTSAIENASPAANITSSEINTEVAAQTPESAAETQSQMGSEGAGQDTDEELAGIYDKDGLDPEGYDREGFDKAGYDHEDYDRSGYDRDGYNREGYDQEGFNEAGLDKNGFDKDGFDKEGFNKNGFDNDGFNKEGFNADGFDKEGFDQAGFDQEGFNREGFNQAGFDQEGFNQQGFDKAGFDREGFNQAGFDQEGFNREGFDKAGFDREGFNQKGFDKAGFDREGFNQAGFDQEGFNREGFDKAGFDREGFNQKGFDKAGFDREGFNQAGFDQEGFNREGFDKAGFDREGFNQKGFDKTGFDREGFNQKGFDKEGFNREGFNQAGFDKEGFDQKGFNKAGYDRDGYGRNGYDAEGYNREGYDVNGYDRKGYNSSGYNAKGYDRQGYDRDGFNKDGLDRDGYNRSGLDKNGYDREGYDKAGYDKDGYDREGFDKDGRQREGYDENGYDKKGFNKDGFDKDGFDREGFNFEGYNRSGYDPWGYNRQGYGKDGYHWSGYNADGYSRDGKHWSENPFEGDGNPFNVAERDAYVENGYISFADKWKPTKPPLGEPYQKTLEKYGAKPWTNDPPQPEVEKPTVPAPEDTGVIGPEDPMNTLKNHEVGQGEPKVPEDSSIPENIPEKDWPEDGGDIPADQVETGDSNTFTYTDPETGETTTYEYEKGYTGPRQGDTQTLVGKADGQTYELKFDAVKGKWINTETGNDFNPDDFDRWQDDLAEDKRRIAEDIKKMISRQDADSKAVKKNLEDWNRLEQMQKAADKHGIGEKGGPGDVDKAIQDLKDDMLAGKEVDQDKLEQINKIIDNRIQGNTTADTGRRFEEKPWYQDVDSALKANAAMAKEVVTGEKDDGSISYLGITARIMITAATGGGASLTTVAGEITRQGVMDGILTVAEAMYRIKDSIDKGESDFRAVSKAIGLTILGEEVGWLAGAAGGQLMKQMLERFPVFTNKAADFIEKGLLKIMQTDQMVSRGLGMISKEGAEETLDQIQKRLTDLGTGMGEESVDKAMSGIGRGIAGSGDDIAKGAGKVVSGSGDDIARGGGKAASGSGDDIARGGGKAVSGSGDDIARGGGKAVSGSGDDIARGGGKAVSGSGDDIARGGGKAASGSGDDIARGGSKAASGSGDDLGKGGGKAASGSAGDGPKAPDGPDAPGKAGADGGDGPGEPGGPSSGGPDDGVPGGTPEQSIARGGRSADQVMSDPAAVAKAERTVQNNIEDFDRLPPAQQQELVREQAIYDEYRIQAEEKAWNLADKVQRGERLTLDDILEMKADPAAMRILKKIENADGLGSQLTTMEARQIKTEFNNVLRDRVHQPSNREVQDFLSTQYNGVEIRVDTVRTPGTQTNPWDINTDNDVIASRLVNGPNGPEWVEIPKVEWENEYYEAFARNTGFDVDDAARRFPEKNWAEMDDAARFKAWAERYEESAMDVFDPEAARDFSGQRTWMIDDGDLPGRPMIEATPDEIARGVETVNIDGKQMRPSSAYELARRGECKLLDAEQLGIMEKNKINKYWNKGGRPVDVMRNQTESMEQLSKTAAATQGLESSYRGMGYKIGNMPDNMQQAIKVVNNNSLSPASRAARLQELGYDTPGDFVEKLTSRMGAIRAARR